MTPDPNPTTFRFSSKYTDNETGLVYYGYRYCQPQTGRWLTRDPIGELSGGHLYSLVRNTPVNSIDPYGLYDVSTAVNSALEILQDSELIKDLKFDAALKKLRRPRAIVDATLLDDDAVAAYSPSKDYVILRDENPSTDAVLHELVHATNRHKGHSRERDEGMAYGFAQVMFGAMKKLSLLEDALVKNAKDGTCQPEADKVSWESHWKEYGKAGNYSGQYKTWYKQTITFPLTETDYWNINQHLGTRLSCAAVAKRVNSLLAEAGCCHRVVCDRSKAGAYTYAPEEDIDEVFE